MSRESLEKVKHYVRGTIVRMQGNSPSLKARVFTRVSFEDLERDTLFSKGLSQRETAEARSNNQDVHSDD